MFDPPPGFLDLISDAEDWPVTGELHDLHIPRIGEVRARKPQPRSAAALAMSANIKAKPGEQMDNLQRFIREQLADGEYERVAEAMIDDELEDDAMQRISRGLATWGTARPYAAVTTLALFTGHNWRTIRHKLTLAGIKNPMALPSLHTLLDITESIVIESLFRSGEKKEGPPTSGERKVQEFYDSIYRPDPTDDSEDDELTETPYVPSGFEDPNEIEDSFDALLRSGG